MKTIVEPKQHIDKLWGKQRVKEDASYRLMKYVLRVDHEGKVLLHNVVTGQLVVLDQEEAETVDQLPQSYSPMMEQLVVEHYLVPEDYDEHRQVIYLRSILRKLRRQGSVPIWQYTIYVTTACNARCYYCFEQGIETVTMSKETADTVVDFIRTHSAGAAEIIITWFGGEPLVAADRIDDICKGLDENEIKYQSYIVSNAYLFDEDMIERARSKWNLKHAQITVDGTETNYNKIKAYIYPQGNPYQRVMRNVSHLLEKKISVTLRMNFDLKNHMDFYELLKDVRLRFPDKSTLEVKAYPVIGEHADFDGELVHGSNDWFSHKVVELNNAAKSNGLKRKRNNVPYLAFGGCIADENGAIVIGAKGQILRCVECYQDNQAVGNIYDGITNPQLAQAWNNIGDFHVCDECVLFPTCVRMALCPSQEECLLVLEREKDFSDAVIHQYRSKM